jgi:hypothetical protein
MQMFKIIALIVVMSALLLSGCGGGGGSAGSAGSAGGAGGAGGGSSVVLALSTQNTAPVTIGGIQLVVTLPVGVSLKTDTNGVLLSNVVQQSGVLSNADFFHPTYDKTTGTISVGITKDAGFGLGEFLTISCDVAAGFSPHLADFILTNVTVVSPLSGGAAALPLVTIVPAFK